jgi:hypothetical protein
VISNISQGDVKTCLESRSSEVAISYSYIDETRFTSKLHVRVIRSVKCVQMLKRSYCECLESVRYLGGSSGSSHGRLWSRYGMFPETWRRVGSASLGEKRRCGVSPSLYFGLLGQILGPSEKQSCEMQRLFSRVRIRLEMRAS